MTVDDTPREEARPARSSGGVGRSAAIMAAGTATSRLLGVVRDAILVAAIGLNAGGANAFVVANLVPNVLFMLIAGGVLNAVLVPQVVRAYRTGGGQEFVDRLLTLAGVLLLVATLALTAAAPLVIRAFAGSASAEFVALATVFAFWCIPQVFFYGVYSLLGQVLNARGSFGPYMWAPVVNNVVAIAGLVVFMSMFGQYDPGGPTDGFAWDPSMIVVLAGSTTLGVVCQALVLVVPLYRSGFRYRPRTGWRGVGLSTAGRVAGWTFAALAVGQVGVLVVQQVAADAADVSNNAADVAANNAYLRAFTIFMLPHSLVTLSLLTAMFTRLSGHAAADDRPAVREDVSTGLRTIGVFTVIATAVLAVLALPVVRVVLPAVSPPEAASLARVVVALVAGLAAFGAWGLCQRVFYAYEDARGLFWIQVTMAGVVAVGTLLGRLVLPVDWWVPAAGGAIAASYVLGAVWGGLHVRRRLGGSGHEVVRLHVRAGLGALVAVAVGWPLSTLFGDLSEASFPRALAVCVTVGLVMLGTYLALLRLMRVHELTDLLAPILRRVGRSMSRPQRG